MDALGKSGVVAEGWDLRGGMDALAKSPVIAEGQGHGWAVQAKAGAI